MKAVISPALRSQSTEARHCSRLAADLRALTKQFLEELRGRIDLIIVLALGKTVISRPSDDPRPDDAIRDAQRGGAGRGGAAQHVAGNGADARDRSEHRGGLVVDGFLMEVDDAAGIRQIVRHEHDATYRQRRVVPHLRKLVVGTAADNAAAQARDGAART